MNLLLNSHPITLPEGCTLARLLERQEALPQYFAVAVNESVVPRRHWESTLLSEGDRVLIIGAVQGG